MQALNYFFRISCFLLIACCLSCSYSRRLEKDLTQKEFFPQAFSGFLLFDPEAGDTLLSYQADYYYTPASNTKLLTYYAVTQTFPDSLPLLTYQTIGDSVYFEGTGFPGTLHPELPADSNLIRFFQQANKTFFYCPSSAPARFGPGWAWDDFGYAFQPERSAFPVYGNCWWARQDTTGFVQTFPDLFPIKRYQPDGERIRLFREEASNHFRLFPAKKPISSQSRAIPFIFQDEIVVAALKDTFDLIIQLAPDDSPLLDAPKTLYSAIPSDTIYRKLLQESDNFLAEQLLLQCAWQWKLPFSDRKIHQHLQDSVFQDFPEGAIWVDGSGLSRYNLITPRFLVHLLSELYYRQGQEVVFNHLPAGGVSGTIRNWYAADQPYVFAKTGTLRNKHCLSGFVKTRSGRILVFSFMHNNFPGSSSDMKKDMEKILKQVWENF